jgi:hypothetical protein
LEDAAASMTVEPLSGSPAAAPSRGGGWRRRDTLTIFGNLPPSHGDLVAVGADRAAAGKLL